MLNAETTRAESGSDEKKRILFVLPSLTRAGAESQVLDLIETLDDRVWCKYLVTFEPTMDQVPRLKGLNVEFRHFRRGAKADFLFVRDIARLIDGEGIDVVHATLNIAVLSAWLAKVLSRRKPPLMAAIHTTIQRDRKNEIADFVLYRRILKRCDQILFISHRQREYWKRKLPFVEGMSGVVYNGIDVARYHGRTHSVTDADAANENETAGCKIVVCVAAFRPEKGHTILLEAWPRVLNDHPDAVLYLVGDGPDYERIQAVVRACSLESSVRFTGSLADVRPMFAAAKLTVLPSIAVETFSLAALESMAMEVPVIATNIGGMAEAVIDGETGLILPPGDKAALAQGISALLSDESRRRQMARAGRDHVLANFDRRVMAERTSELLLRTLDESVASASR